MKVCAVLSADCAGRVPLLAERGLSLFIRYGKSDFLFDTGGGFLFAENARFMNIPLEKIAFAVLSHSHGDHVGGIGELSRKFSMISASCDVFCTSDMPLPKLPALRFKPIISSLKIDEDKTLIVTESAGNDGKKLGEISLVAGGALFVGCAHAGIETILDLATQHAEITSIIGGFHNFAQSGNELRKSAERLFEKGVKDVVFLHCSNLLGIRYFEDVGIRCKIGKVGQNFSIS